MKQFTFLRPVNGLGNLGAWRAQALWLLSLASWWNVENVGGSEEQCSTTDLKHVQAAWDAEMGYDQYCRENERAVTGRGPWVDKYAAKEQVVRAVPGIRTTRTLFVTDDPTQFTQELLKSFPNKYVVKATHGSQMTLMVDGNRARCLRVAMAHKRKFCVKWTTLVKEEHAAFIQDNCRRWLEVAFGNISKQPVYSEVSPRCIVEESLVENDGDDSPPDVKVFVVHGRPLFLHITASQKRTDTYTTGMLLPYNALSGSMMTTDWQLIPAAKHKRLHDACGRCSKAAPAQAAPAPFPPALLARYLELAAALGSLFPVVRVDFFRDQHEPVFQELTFTTDNCKPSFVPAILSRTLHYLASNPGTSISSPCIGHVVKSVMCPCDKTTNTSAQIWRAIRHFNIEKLYR